jgi:hypothetical protein
MKIPANKSENGKHKSGWCPCWWEDLQCNHAAAQTFLGLRPSCLNVSLRQWSSKTQPALLLQHVDGEVNPLGQRKLREGHFKHRIVLQGTQGL